MSLGADQSERVRTATPTACGSFSGNAAGSRALDAHGLRNGLLVRGGPLSFVGGWLAGGPAKMAATNKCLAQSNKSTGGQSD